MTLYAELAWFEKNQNRLKRQHPGRVLVIVNQEVLGNFEDVLDALKFAEQMDLPKCLIRNVNHGGSDRE